jgi:hypothetical protein
VQEDNVRKRIYRGFCTDRGTLKDAIDQIRPLRGEVLALFTNTPGFEPAQIKRDMAFIDRFFEKLNSENATSRFERSCR